MYRVHNLKDTKDHTVNVNPAHWLPNWLLPSATRTATVSGLEISSQTKTEAITRLRGTCSKRMRILQVSISGRKRTRGSPRRRHRLRPEPLRARARSRARATALDARRRGRVNAPGPAHSRLFRAQGAGFTSLPGDWLNPEVIPEDPVAAEDPGGRARFGTMSW